MLVIYNWNNIILICESGNDLILLFQFDDERCFTECSLKPNSCCSSTSSISMAPVGQM